MILSFWTSLSRSSDEVVIIEQGQPAPYTGYLFSKEKAQLTRIKLIEGEEAIRLNLSYAKSLDLYEKNKDKNNEMVNTLLEQNDKLSKSLNASRSVSDLEKILWFLGGALAVGAATYGAARLAK